MKEKVTESYSLNRTQRWEVSVEASVEARLSIYKPDRHEMEEITPDITFVEKRRSYTFVGKRRLCPMKRLHGHAHPSRRMDYGGSP